MILSEYERILNLSEMELYAEIQFDITVPKWIADVHNYQMRFQQDLYRSLMIPRTMLYYLDGV